MSRTAHPRGLPRHTAAPETKADARLERRSAERAGLRRFLDDPEADVVLPTETRHANSAPP